MSKEALLKLKIAVFADGVMIMKRSEIEDLILGPVRGHEGTDNNHPAHSSRNELAVVTDPEQRGLVRVSYVGSEKDWVSVLVLDAAGTICLQREKRSKKGDNFFQLDLQHLPQGRYRLRLLSTNGLLSGNFSL